MPSMQSYIVGNGVSSIFDVRDNFDDLYRWVLRVGIQLPMTDLAPVRSDTIDAYREPPA